MRLNGKLIKAIRKADGLRQEDLIALCEASNETSISLRSLSNAERGLPVNAETFTRIAKVLRVDPADQLLAEKGVGIAKLRRLNPDGSPPGEPVEARPAQISRLHLDRGGRLELRRFMLKEITPESGYTLQHGGVHFHDDSIEQWSQSAFEGFLAACVFFVDGAIESSDAHGGNGATALLSLLMGKHALRLKDTGIEDGSAHPRKPKLEAEVDEMWGDSGMYAAGHLADALFEACPPESPLNYYLGWLYCCTWLTMNAANNMEIGRDRTVHSYNDILLEMMRSYLDRFEDMQAPGTKIFWGVAHHCLRMQLGATKYEPDEDDFRKKHPHSFRDLIEHVKFVLELNDESIEKYRELVDSYDDMETGYQVAMLTLRTQFMYTGKPSGELIMIDATRIPKSH